MATSSQCSQGSKLSSLPATTGTGSISCCLPFVCEFSTSIQRFNDQITRSVLARLQRRCVTLAPAQPVLLASASFQETLTTTIALTIAATTLTSINVALSNVQFTIVGFSSLIVQVTGDVVVTVQFTGVDGLPHTDTVTIPFAFLQTIPGTFPPNVTISGSLAIVNQIITVEEDPSTLAITGVTITLVLADTIQVFLPAA